MKNWERLMDWRTSQSGEQSQENWIAGWNISKTQNSYGVYLFMMGLQNSLQV